MRSAAVCSGEAKTACVQKAAMNAGACSPMFMKHRVAQVFWASEASLGTEAESHMYV